MAQVGSLGEVDFYVRTSNGKPEILSFHDLTRSSTANFAEHERNGGKPYLEYGGPGLDEINMTIEADVQYHINPIVVQEKLHQYAEAGTPNSLIIGGKRIGSNPFVVTSIADVYKRHFTDGRPLAIAMQITLKEYANQVAKVITIPPAVQIGTNRIDSAPAVRTNYDIYVVVKGDCLWNIAKRYYGAGAQYTKIYNANSGIIKNPSLIYPGQVLKIPK